MAHGSRSAQLSLSRPWVLGRQLCILVIMTDMVQNQFNILVDITYYSVAESTDDGTTPGGRATIDEGHN